ncbi:hypothetical protein [Vibrio parahaemolyticus]|uniref:hypothetical protein n=3 Tax=Vibrio parahaemolyticus TaxID=670 RepID=UPI00235F7634|nr:hypothetical protein [Vibrio parahaemolyticus]
MKSIENNTSSDKADLLKDAANIVTQKQNLLMIFPTLVVTMYTAFMLITFNEADLTKSLAAITAQLMLCTWIYMGSCDIRESNLINNKLLYSGDHEALIEAIKETIKDRGCDEYEDERYKKIYSKFNDDNVILVQDFRWLVAYLKITDTLEKRKAYYSKVIAEENHQQ